MTDSTTDAEKETATTTLKDDLRAQLKDKNISYSNNASVERLQELLDEANKAPAKPAIKVNPVHELVRVRITCNDPSKAGVPGTIYSVSNTKYGTISKYIPYRSQEAYHIPKLLLESLKEAEFLYYNQDITGANAKRGIPSYTHETRKLFNIDVLPPLTEAELIKLAADQRARMSV